MNGLEKIKDYWIIGVAVAVVASWLIYQRLYSPVQTLVSIEEVELMDDQTTDATEEAEITAEEEGIAEMIYVDLKGAVQSPGVYQMDGEARLFDLLEEAGGLLPEAALDSLNQAMRLEDQMVIHIWTQSEYEQHQEDTFEDEAWDLSYIEGASPKESEAELININTASVDELQTLPGIGPKKAEAIIHYREEAGSYQSIEEIMEVSGIGAKTFEQLASYICVK